MMLDIPYIPVNEYFQVIIKIYLQGRPCIVTVPIIVML